MRTNNMSDEELDNLFRKSFESLDPPYDPEAWHAMEKKLDRVGGGHAWWFKYFFPLLLFVYTCLMVADTRLSQLPVASREHLTTKVPGSTLTEERKKFLGSDESRRIKKKKQQASEKLKLPSGVQTGYPPQATSRNAEEKNVVPTFRNRTHQLIAQADPVKEKAAKEVQQTKDKAFSEEKEALAPALHAAPHTRILSTAIVADSVAVTAGPSPLPAVTLSENEIYGQATAYAATDSAEGRIERMEFKKKKAFFSSLQIAALAAPDFTTVRFKHPDAVSANAGLILSVPITNKLSLETGIVWANKVYGANPEDYSPTSGYWNSTYLPVSIDANCKVLDIPLNLSYRILEWDKNSIAILAGLSSYMMLKENYTYHYATYSKSVAYANEYSHLLGVQNLSVRYARKITPLLSVGVEPFVKVPLTGIGAGDVKLSSAGVFFTAGYTVFLKK